MLIAPFNASSGCAGDILFATDELFLRMTRTRFDGFLRSIERIRNARYVEDIREFVRSYPARSFHKDSALYSGMVGKKYANRIAGLERDKD